MAESSDSVAPCPKKLKKQSHFLQQWAHEFSGIGRSAANLLKNEAIIAAANDSMTLSFEASNQLSDENLGIGDIITTVLIIFTTVLMIFMSGCDQLG